jgi:Sodium/hydrogen exchanger family
MLPNSVLPDPNRRLLTSLFLATALSVSSVKIVAAVLREVDYLRRNLGQVILAAAILDDTIGWTIFAFIGGLAAQGRIVIGPVLFSVSGHGSISLFLLHHRTPLGRANYSLDQRPLCHRVARHQCHPGNHDCSGAGD